MRARRVAACVACGVVASMVSAWPGAVIAQRREFRPPTTIPLRCGTRWAQVADPGLVEELPRAWRGERWTTTELEVCDTPLAYEPANHISTLPTGGWRQREVRRAIHGWPWNSAKSIRLFDTHPDGGATQPAAGARRVAATFAYRADEMRLPLWRRGVCVPNPGGTPDEHLLPINPVWPGFAYNALVFGGGAWALLAAPSLVGLAVGRKRRRRERGLCVACGYDVAGLDACPECGRAKAGRPVERPAGGGQSRL